MSSLTSPNCCVSGHFDMCSDNYDSIYNNRGCVNDISSVNPLIFLAICCLKSMDQLQATSCIYTTAITYMRQFVAYL